MSRYIDAEWLIKESMPLSFSVQKWVNEVQIMTAPSIDIVRCKECMWLRYRETEDFDIYLDCDKPDGGGIPRSEEWFCADGERVVQKLVDRKIEPLSEDEILREQCRAFIGIVEQTEMEE